MERKKILFVCYGNICRSPTAQGIFEKLIKDKDLTDKFELDSAGTSGYHSGSKPDSRSISAAINRGIDISGQKSRKVEFSDFIEFDYILAMDKSNYEDLISLCDRNNQYKISLMLEHGSLGFKEVPDPYYGGNEAFEQVIELLTDACEGFLKKIM